MLWKVTSWDYEFSNWNIIIWNKNLHDELHNCQIEQATHFMLCRDIKQKRTKISEYVLAFLLEQ